MKSLLCFLLFLVSCQYSSEKSSSTTRTTTGYSTGVDEFHKQLEGKTDEYILKASVLLDEFDKPDAKNYVLAELEKLDFFAWKFSNYSFHAKNLVNAYSVVYDIKIYSDSDQKRVLEIEINGETKRKILH